MPDDRRATIEAALQVETAEAGQTQQPETQVTDQASDSGATGSDNSAVSSAGNESAAAESGAGESTPTGGMGKSPTDPDAESPTAKTKTYSTDKPPQSWRPAQKSKWGSVDAEVRQEIIRREREIETTLGNTASERQLAKAFQQTVQPFMARIQSMNIHPIMAVGELLKADHVLSTAPTAQRAQFMAKLIKDYGVDVAALDSALSGQGTVDPTESKLDALLKQRLAPLESFMTSQQRQAEEQRQTVSARMTETVGQMAADTAKYPHFDSVREDMADIVEIQAKKGVYLTLDQAYNRAVAMNPDLIPNSVGQDDSRRQANAAQLANARAQRSKAASKSVGGAPSGGGTGASPGNDRRSTIAAALAQAEGR